MSTQPYGPRLLKGALVAVDLATGQRNAIIFQYNPETLSRSLQPQMAGGEQGQHTPVVRFTGAPIETLTLEVTIDATDQLESGDGQALSMGIHPQLNALEMLLYPQSEQVIQNNRVLGQGSIEIGPYLAPLTLFVWGGNRVLPVLLTGVSSREEMFDTHLNPLRASVTLTMRALSYSDLDSSHKGYHLFLAYQGAKEVMARRGLASDPGSAIGVDINRF
ncbi:MAG: hypothetical protein ACK2U9_12735 [Anaerolineae bacterium]